MSAAAVAFIRGGQRRQSGTAGPNGHAAPPPPAMKPPSPAFLKLQQLLPHSRGANGASRFAATAKQLHPFGRSNGGGGGTASSRARPEPPSPIFSEAAMQGGGAAGNRRSGRRRSSATGLGGGEGPASPGANNGGYGQLDEEDDDFYTDDEDDDSNSSNPLSHSPGSSSPGGGRRDGGGGHGHRRQKSRLIDPDQLASSHGRHGGRRKRSTLFTPQNEFKRVWDLMMLVVILYYAMTTPFRIGFDAAAEGVISLFEDICTTLFFIDIGFSFNTIFFTDDGRMINDRAEIARQYLRFWFWVDLFGSLPYEKLEGVKVGQTDLSDLGLLRALRLLRLLRLFKLLKLDAFIEHIEIHFNTDMRPFRVTFLVVKLLYLSHLLACGWYFVADSSHEAWGVTTWIIEYQLHGHGDGTPVEDVSVTHKYLLSVYWTLTTLTTVGYGDITPMNDAERVFASVTLLVGGLSFGYMIGNISTMIEQLNRQGALVRERMDIITDYLRWRKLPLVLATRIKLYYSHHYAMRPLCDERHILDELSPALRAEATKHVLRTTIGRLSIMDRTLEPEFQLEVFPLLKPVLWSKDELIHKKGAPCMDLLFLMEGQVAVLAASEPDDAIYKEDAEYISEIDPKGEHLLKRFPSRDSGTLKRFLDLQTGGCFGEEVFTMPRRPYTCVARLPARALFISKDDLTDLTMKNPKSMRRLRISLLQRVAPKERLRCSGEAFVINMTQKQSVLWGALKCQRVWRRHVMRMHQEAIRAMELSGMTQSEADYAISIEFEALGDSLLATSTNETLEAAARGGAARAAKLAQQASKTLAKEMSLSPSPKQQQPPPPGGMPGGGLVRQQTATGWGVGATGRKSPSVGCGSLMPLDGGGGGGGMMGGGGMAGHCRRGSARSMAAAMQQEAEAVKKHNERLQRATERQKALSASKGAAALKREQSAPARIEAAHAHDVGSPPNTPPPPQTPPPPNTPHTTPQKLLLSSSIRPRIDIPPPSPENTAAITRALHAIELGGYAEAMLSCGYDSLTHLLDGLNVDERREVALRIGMIEGHAHRFATMLPQVATAPPMAAARVATMAGGGSFGGGGSGGGAALEPRKASPEPISTPQDAQDAQDAQDEEEARRLAVESCAAALPSSPFSTKLLQRKVANQSTFGQGDPNRLTSPQGTALMERKMGRGGEAAFAGSSDPGQGDPNRLTSPVGTALMERKMAHSSGAPVRGTFDDVPEGDEDAAGDAAGSEQQAEEGPAQAVRDRLARVRETEASQRV